MPVMPRRTPSLARPYAGLRTPGPTPPLTPAFARRATRRRYLMCPPSYFDVTYAINPWMDPTRPVDPGRAMAQWDHLRRVFVGLGHSVELVEPEPGLPDMIFAANGGLVVGPTAIGARFRHAERRGEEEAYLRWFADTGGFPDVRRPGFDNEGEGDFLLAGGVVLAGSGFRTDVQAHAEVARLLRREVVSLELVDPRFYHLDTALAVLDDTTIAYLPGAFSPASQTELRRRFPEAVIASDHDAAVFGLNAVSDGRNVVLSDEATDLASDLTAAGFNPIGVAMDEIRRAGGGAKCCTLELHRVAKPRHPGRHAPDRYTAAAV